MAKRRTYPLASPEDPVPTYRFITDETADLYLFEPYLEALCRLESLSSP